MNVSNLIKIHLDEHLSVAKSIEVLAGDIEIISNVLVKALSQNKTIFWCGNGGSASDSQHLAGELVGRFNSDRKPLRSIALNADSAVMTCIVNDYGYDYLFSRQVQALGSRDDVLVAISTSGNSKNVINAVLEAKKMNIKTIGFLGKTGGELLQLVDYPIHIKSNSTARVQEMHIMIGHILCDLIETGLNLKI